MARIKPFRAWRYHPKLTHRIGDLTSPLFDVVNEQQRAKLYQNPLNSIHLSVPSGESPIDNAAHTLTQWKKDKAIVQDKTPSIYVYYQHFSLPGDPTPKCRKGFIAMMTAYHWNEGVLLRHENTIPKAVNDRIDLLKATQLNVSPTHGLYTDEHFSLEPYMDEAMKHPIYDEEDYQGVRDVLAIIDDPDIVQKFVEVLAAKQVILADGHHRYESSMVYRQDCMKANPHHTGDEPYNFHTIFLTNTEADDLRILPTHRLLQGFPNLDIDHLLGEINRYFDLKELSGSESVHEIILGKKWAFGLVTEDQCYKIRLKPEALDLMDWNFPEVVKELDLTVLHYFLFEKVLGIHRNQQRTSPYLKFERNYSTCLSKVWKGEAQVAFITNEIPVETVKKVCRSGFTMPQKSTYFYPKVVCGFLFGDISE